MTMWNDNDDFLDWLNKNYPDIIATDETLDMMEEAFDAGYELGYEHGSDMELD